MSAIRERANLFDDLRWSPLNTNPRDKAAANGLTRRAATGETWHHNPEQGDMMLFDARFHSAFTTHAGGGRTYGDDTRRGGLPEFGASLFEEI